MPFDPNFLPTLGEGSQPITEEPLWLKVLKQRKLKGLLGDNFEYEIKARKAKIDGHLGNLGLSGLLGYDGDWSLGAQYPLFDGMLRFNAKDQDGNRNYGLQYERQF